MTHPGVGPIAALTTETFLSDPQRFVDGKAAASYVGLIPAERANRAGFVGMFSTVIQKQYRFPSLHAFANIDQELIKRLEAD